MDKPERPQNKHLIYNKGRKRPYPPLKKKIKRSIVLSYDTLQLVDKLQELYAESGLKLNRSEIIRQAVDCGIKILIKNLII